MIVAAEPLFGGLLAAFLESHCNWQVVARFQSAAAAAANPFATDRVICDLRHVTEDACAQQLAELRAAYPGAEVTGLGSGIVSVDDVMRLLGQPSPAGFEVLTPVERRVFVEVGRGRRNVDVSRLVRRSAKTVEKHRASAMRKLGLRNLAEVTAYCIRFGLLDAGGILAAAALRRGSSAMLTSGCRSEGKPTD